MCSSIGISVISVARCRCHSTKWLHSVCLGLHRMQSTNNVLPTLKMKLHIAMASGLRSTVSLVVFAGDFCLVEFLPLCRTENRQRATRLAPLDRRRVGIFLRRSCSIGGRGGSGSRKSLCRVGIFSAFFARSTEGNWPVETGDD